MGSSKVLWRRFAQGEKMQVHSTRVLNGFSAQTARADLRLVQDETLVFVVGCGEPRRASRLLHDQTRRMTRRMPSSSTATGTQKWLSVRMARSISVLGTGEHSIGFGRAPQDRPEGGCFRRRAASWRLMRGRDRRLIPGLQAPSSRAANSPAWRPGLLPFSLPRRDRWDALVEGMRDEGKWGRTAFTKRLFQWRPVSPA